MKRVFGRRAALALAAAAALLAGGCGSSRIESALTPARFVVFGDGTADVGQGGSRYTVNDGSNNLWVLQLAAAWGRTVTPAVSGGTGYARGNARVAAKPDAAGNAATPTVQEQITAFLAAGTIGTNDVLVLSAGLSDIVAEMARVNAGSQTTDQMLANLRQAGRDLAAQTRRLVQAGAKYVVVAGPYNLGRSPWGRNLGQTGLLEQATNRFNEEFLIGVADLGANVLYIDAALQYNLMTASPSGYGFNDATTLVCTSVDPGPGIGIGSGQVNAALCNTGTIASGLDYGRYIFADAVHPTPQAHRKFGEHAISKLRDRW